MGSKNSIIKNPFVFALVLFSTVEAAEQQIDTASKNDTLYYLGIVSLVILLYLMATRTKNREEYVEQITTQSVVDLTEKEESKSGAPMSEKEKLFKMVDQSGPFEKTPQGSLDPESFVRLRILLNNHCLNEFKPIKEDLLAKRVAAFKAE